MVKVFGKLVVGNNVAFIPLWESDSEHITDLCEWSLLEEDQEPTNRFSVSSNDIHLMVQELLGDYYGNDADPDLLDAVVDLIILARMMDSEHEYFVDIIK